MMGLAARAADIEIIVALDAHQNGGAEEPAYDIRRQPRDFSTVVDPELGFSFADLGRFADGPVCDDQLIKFSGQASRAAAEKTFKLAVNYQGDGSLLISWLGGKLETAADLGANHWVKLWRLQSPALLRAGASARFFRVVE